MISRQNVPTHTKSWQRNPAVAFCSFFLLRQRHFVLLLVCMNLKRRAWAARSENRYGVSSRVTWNWRQELHRDQSQTGSSSANISYMLSYMLSVDSWSEPPGTDLEVVSLAAFAVPAAGHALHHLLPLSRATREAADGGRQRRVARLPAHGLQLRGGEWRKVITRWRYTVIGGSIPISVPMFVSYWLLEMWIYFFIQFILEWNWNFGFISWFSICID